MDRAKSRVSLRLQTFRARFRPGMAYRVVCFSRVAYFLPAARDGVMLVISLLLQP